MDKRIAIILTSIERPQALKKSVESIIATWQDNWVLLIGNQCIKDDMLFDKRTYDILNDFIRENPDKDIRTYELDYNCGISKARNELIQKAYLWHCDYVLLTADSISFDESMQSINMIIDGMDWNNFDICGIELTNRIAWEANINLIKGECFELDFIHKEKHNCFFKCDIVRNFWIAKTESILKVPYDEQLIMCEHEDFFWRVKEQGLIVGCTNLCSGTYEKPENTPKYDEIRSTNFRIGMQRLKNKYSLKGWVTYKNLENTKL